MSLQGSTQRHAPIAALRRTPRGNEARRESGAAPKHGCFFDGLRAMLWVDGRRHVFVLVLAAS